MQLLKYMVVCLISISYGHISIFPYFLSLHTEILASHTFQPVYLCVFILGSLQVCSHRQHIIHSPSNYHYCFKAEDIWSFRQPSRTKQPFSVISFHDNQRISFQSDRLFPTKLHCSFKYLQLRLGWGEPWADSILLLCFNMIFHIEIPNFKTRRVFQWKTCTESQEFQYFCIRLWKFNSLLWLAFCWVLFLNFWLI